MQFHEYRAKADAQAHTLLVMLRGRYGTAGQFKAEGMLLSFP